MDQEIFIDPIRRLRELGAAQIKNERSELFEAFRESIADDVALTKQQGEEIEDCVMKHDRWFSINSPRLEAVRVPLASIATYEMKRDLYRNQIASALRETEQVSIHSLWGRRADGQRDPSIFKAVVSGVKNRLGQARGLCGSLDRLFFQVEVELVALEKRGFGLPPEPVPFMVPPKPEQPTTANDGFDPRKPYKKQTV